MAINKRSRKKILTEDFLSLFKTTAEDIEVGATELHEWSGNGESYKVYAIVDIMPDMDKRIYIDEKGVYDLRFWQSLTQDGYRCRHYFAKITDNPTQYNMKIMNIIRTAETIRAKAPKSRLAYKWMLASTLVDDTKPKCVVIEIAENESHNYTPEDYESVYKEYLEVKAEHFD